MKPERILVRSVNWLGDAIMTLPALRALRQHFPESKIILLTHQKLAGLWEGQHYVDDLLTFGKEDNFFTTSKIARKAQADLAILFPNSPRTAMEAWFAGIPKRMAYRGKFPRSLFLNAIIPNRKGVLVMKKRTESEIKKIVALSSSETRFSEDLTNYNPRSHHIFHYLDLIAPLGIDATEIEPKLDIDLRKREEVCRKFAIPSDLACFGINPGAEYGPAKRWPVENFVETIDSISATRNVGWILFGGSADKTLTQQIAEESIKRNPKLKIYNVAGRTTIRELSLLSSRCQCFITNDTGPMHVAAASGTTVVVPFLSTSPELTGPGAPCNTKHLFIKADTPCAPCFLRNCPIDFRCCKQVTPKKLIQKMESAGVLSSFRSS